MSTILIVDDNKKNLQILGNVLHEKTYRVAMAIDGPSALKLAEKLMPDLIVLDIMMPGMDGFEVCSILKSQPKTKEIPIIFLTAKVDLDDIVKGFKVGGADYVTKPFKKEELLARIATQIALIESQKKILLQKQELADINVLKDKIFAVVASDVKRALDNFIEVPKLLTNPKINLSAEEINDLLNELHHKATATSELLENVLWWSKLMQNQVSACISRVNVHALLQKLLAHFADLIQEKEINIVLQVNETDQVITDAELLHIILKNIIHNAIKFSHKAQTINIDFQSTDSFNSIRIKDEGIGIEKDNLAKITSAYQYHSSYGTQNEKGSGIGLKVVNELISICDGTISFESNSNTGTLVSIQFPKELKI
ncbi:MAG: response regulator [Prolixibacteraceae bacterium]